MGTPYIFQDVPETWLEVAKDCHRRNQEWCMWISLLWWAQLKQEQK